MASAIAQMVRTCKELTTLRMGENQLGDSVAKPIFELAGGHKALTHLDSSGNGIALDSIEALAASGALNLEWLDISYNLIGTKEAIALAPLLPSHAVLRSLNLSWNAIDDQG